jgi:hypothetical protein
MERYISNKFNNYCVTVVVAVVVFLIMEIIYHLTGTYDAQSIFWKRFTLLAMLVGSGYLVYEVSYYRVLPMQRVQVLFLGEQTGIWLEEGIYFIWFHGLGIFGLQEDEAHSHEKNDVYVPPFETRDQKGKKVVCHIDADWEIIDSDIYKLIKADDMPRNLNSALTKEANNHIGSREFVKDLLGHNHGDDINNATFKARMHSRFGINFSHIDCIVMSGDLAQDNLNNYRNELTAKFKRTHKTLGDKEIAELVEVQLKLVKKIISNAPLINRNDVNSIV